MEKLNTDHIHFSYIIGIGRSGTTLLSKLLNYHKQCLVSPELEFAVFFMGHFGSKTRFTEAEYKTIVRFFELYALRHPVLKEILNTDKLFEELRGQEFSDYASLIKFLHLRFNIYQKPIEEIRLIIDKNPSYTLHTEKLLKLDAESRFICMIRDYRANILSRKQSIEFRSPDTAFNCYRWLFFNKRVYRHLKRKDIFMLLKYEDLAFQPQEELTRVFDFLKISSVEEARNAYKEKDVLLDVESVKGMRERYNKTFSDIERPVFTDRVEAWKKELSEKDLKICETICGNLALKFGYEKTLKISWSERFRIKASVFPQRVWASYDYYKEFVLYYVSPAVKLKRIEQKQA